jgi:prepilin-type N-terminal cleavage/methylation domain-containing protein/prepilin-type processing-associated H-X9-DG protein
MTPSRRHAFTLIELLVVIAIIAILAAMIYPVYQRITANSKAAACLSNLRQIGMAMNGYLNENQNIMPSLQVARSSTNDNVPVIDNTFDKYLTDKRVFVCPADNKGYGTTSGTSYYWNSALNGQAVASLNFLQLVTDSTHIPIISDKEGFHPYLDNKVNILYADGHVTNDVKFFTGSPSN